MCVVLAGTCALYFRALDSLPVVVAVDEARFALHGHSIATRGTDLAPAIIRPRTSTRSGAGSCTRRTSAVDPSRLFYTAGAPASAGTLAMSLAAFLGVPVHDVAHQQERPPMETALLWIVAVGFVASPLVPASFSEPGAIGKALSLPLFATILCTLGVRACWTRPAWLRAVVVLLLGLALAQFVAFYRSLI